MPAVLHALAADLIRTSAMAVADVKFAVYRSGLDAVGYAKGNVPVRTGELKNSIGVQYSATGLQFDLEAEADHAAYVEYGTSRMAPRPFVGPAVERAGRELQAKLQAVPPPSLMSLAARWR